MMKQMTFADAEYAGKRKRTREELFLIEMDGGALEGICAIPDARTGSATAILRWKKHCGKNDNLRQFSGLSLEQIRMAPSSNFRRLLEKHELATGILAVINGYLGDRGLSLRQGTIVDAAF
ncbi:unnamed protein product, partial [Mesorhabditis spiculigera]